MSDFLPKKVYLQGILLPYLTEKKSATDAHRILVETYSNYVLLKTTYEDRFRCFKNNDFDVEGQECFGAPKMFEGKELEALLHEDSYQV